MRARRVHGTCRCGKHLFERENEGSCAWCGHGTCDSRSSLHEGLAEMARRNAGCRPRLTLDHHAA